MSRPRELTPGLTGRQLRVGVGVSQRWWASRPARTVQPIGLRSIRSDAIYGAIAAADRRELLLHHWARHAHPVSFPRLVGCPLPSNLHACLNRGAHASRFPDCHRLDNSVAQSALTGGYDRTDCYSLRRFLASRLRQNAVHTPLHLCARALRLGWRADDQSGCNGDQREMIDHVTSGGGVAVDVPFDVSISEAKRTDEVMICPTCRYGLSCSQANSDTEVGRPPGGAGAVFRL